MKYTNIFFDLDDTLIDTISNTQQTLKEIYDDYNIAQYFESFDDFYFNTFRPNNLHLWHEYEHQRITKEDLKRERFIGAFRSVDAISDAYALEINDDYLRRIVTKNTIIDGAIEILEYLKPKYKIHIISNGFTEMQYTKIENTGLNGYFDQIILSDKVGVNKPHPDIYKYALDLAKTDPKEVIMIGDNYSTDITGARNTGIDQIWYNPRGAEASDFIPTYSIAKLAEIKGVL